MSNTVEYSCQVLNGTNKAGVIKQRSDGTYPMSVGALNMTNNKGEYYEYSYAKKFFDEASDLVRMAKKNVLIGEYGHPEQKPGESDASFIQRLLRLDEKSECVHHNRIYLDFDNHKDGAGRPIIGIMSDLFPSGPYGDSLQKKLEDGRQEVCFSIRCFSLPRKINGRVIKEMKHVVTFDYVNEPGIATATKYHSPTMESHSEHLFTQGTLREAASRVLTNVHSNEAAQVPLVRLMSSMGWEVRNTPQAKRNFMELLRTPLN